MAKRTSRSNAQQPGSTTTPPSPAAPKVRRARAAKPPKDASPDHARSDSAAFEPSDDAIRRRAYQRYLERGGGHGTEFEDWLHAERELKTGR